MSRILYAFLVLLLGSACVQACKNTSQPEAVSEGGQPVLVEAVPPDFNMVFGQGGGFTGQWDGYTIRADGTVLAWSGRMAGEGAQPVGTLPADTLEALWGRIQEAGYFDQHGEETGNMTAFMEVTAGGRTHRRSWIPSIEGVEPATAPVERLYRYGLETAREASSR